MGLFKKWFINPIIEKHIVLLEIDRKRVVNSIHPKMGLQEKANLFCKGNEYDFAIKTLKEML